MSVPAVRAASTDSLSAEIERILVAPIAKFVHNDAESMDDGCPAAIATEQEVSRQLLSFAP